ncbi:hypothetical protein TL16_g09595 [Triparma laevis f. inornata]|uniref:Uncharacterized protein n=1 Tax=Triparma laevis f. inornata TaxID=1714386 RepID=A0A9W7B3X3_9STRA|nr:hypothetical protein TL16_g09595 [Triparma laevis f. inornata]
MKRVTDDEKKENEEGIIEDTAANILTTSTAVSAAPVAVFAAPAAVDEFMFTKDCRMLLVGFVMGDTLMTLRLATKAWKAVVEEVIDQGVESGAIMFHDGKDIIYQVAVAREERLKLATRVLFLLNITKVGVRACSYSINLVVVDIPDGVESNGSNAFGGCISLATVFFPATLNSIGDYAFSECSCLENVDLLHTNLQELGSRAFYRCTELKINDNPGLASNAWLPRLQILLQGSPLQH